MVTFIHSGFLLGSLAKVVDILEVVVLDLILQALI